MNWKDLTYKDKWELYSGWRIILIIGNIVNIIASTFLLISTETSQRQGERLLGVAGFLIVI